MKKRKAVRKPPKVVVKKRRVAKKKTKPQKAELVSRARLSREMRAVMSTVRCVRSEITAIKLAMGEIQYAQEIITENIEAVMKDYIRHPLKVDGMNQAALRSLVDAAARNYPEMFKDDFNGRLGISDD